MSLGNMLSNVYNDTVGCRLIHCMHCNMVIFLHNIGLTSLSSITFRDNNIYTLCDDTQERHNVWLERHNLGLYVYIIILCLYRMLKFCFVQ